MAVAAASLLAMAPALLVSHPGLGGGEEGTPTLLGVAVSLALLAMVLVAVTLARRALRGRAADRSGRPSRARAIGASADPYAPGAVRAAARTLVRELHDARTRRDDAALGELVGTECRAAWRPRQAPADLSPAPIGRIAGRVRVCYLGSRWDRSERQEVAVVRVRVRIRTCSRGQERPRRRDRSPLAGANPASLSVVVLAHLGHWYGSLAFGLPLLLMLAWIKGQGWREGRPRRRRAREARRRRTELRCERWEMARRDGRWVLLAVVPEGAFDLHSGIAEASSTRPAPGSPGVPGGP